MLSIRKKSFAILDLILALPGYAKTLSQPKLVSRINKLHWIDGSVGGLSREQWTQSP
jgi:hypothetical protein